MTSIQAEDSENGTADDVLNRLRQQLHQFPHHLELPFDEFRVLRVFSDISVDLERKKQGLSLAIRAISH